MASALKDTADLLELFTGSKKKTTVTQSGGTDTEQTILSPEAVDALVTQILEDTTRGAGLSSVAAGQRSAGMYNSTVNQQLSNDLMARAAAEVAKAGAPKVTRRAPTSTTTMVQTPGMLGSSAMPLLGAATLLGSKGGKEAIGKGVDAISSLFGGGGGGSLVDPTVSAMQGVAQSFPVDLGTSIFEGAGSGAGSASFDLVRDQMGDFADDFIGDVFGSADFGLSSVAPFVGSINQLAQGNYGSAVGSAVGGFFGGPVGSFIGGALGKPVQGVLDIGSDLVQGVGGIIEGIGDFVDSAFDGIFGGCYITTAVCGNSGKPDNCHELTVLRDFRDSYMRIHFPAQLQEYYATAPEIVQKINERPDAATVYKQFERDYIAPAVAAVESENYEGAHAIYLSLVKRAKEIANG